jgi:ligand-binding sensor domain-containing protein
LSNSSNRFDDGTAGGNLKSNRHEWLLSALFALFVSLPCPGQAPVYTSWKNYTVADGMPDEKVLCVAVDGDRVWAGTRNGMVLIENGRILRVFKPEDGLANAVVTAIAVDKNTGDVWMATLGGLSRYSGGEFRNYNNLGSGLANDIVYSVAIQNKYVWAATAAGISRFNTHTGEWSIYDGQNLPGPASPADSIEVTKSKIYFGTWGGGVLEYDIATERWKSYSQSGRAERAPLGSIENFITAVSYDGHMLWASSRFGLSSYDGRSWRHALAAKTSASNAVNMLRSDARGIWIGSDGGLIYFDLGTRTWITYRIDAQSHG